MRRALAAVVVLAVAVLIAAGLHDGPHRTLFPHSGEVGTGGLTATAPARLKAGEVVVGEPLALLTTGSWTEAPSSFTYQWERCTYEEACARIVGATSSTYTPGTGDAGYSVRAKVTAHKGASVGEAKTGVTIGVEPKWGNVNGTGNFWRTNVAAAPLMPEQKRYAEGVEEMWAKLPIEINPEGGGAAPIFFARQGAPREPIEVRGSTAYKTEGPGTETKSVWETEQVARGPWAVGNGKAATADRKALMYELGTNREWVSEANVPTTTYELNEGEETAVGQKAIHLTGAKAKGFVNGARLTFTNLSTGVTTPEVQDIVYYVRAASESGFELAAYPEGPALTVAGAAVKGKGSASVTKVGLLNKTGADVSASFTGSTANTQTAKFGVYQNYDDPFAGEGAALLGAWQPTSYKKEEWRWGTSSGGRPAAWGLLTLEDFRKALAGGKIEHGIAYAAPSRGYRVIGPPKGTGSYICKPGECWSPVVKSDAKAESAARSFGTGTLASSTTVTLATGVTSPFTQGWVKGDGISGTGIPAEDTVTAISGSIGSQTLTLAKAATESKAGVALTHKYGCASVPGAEGKCFIPREGEHWRLKSSTNCTKTEAATTAKELERALCEALKEYGAMSTDTGVSNVAVETQEWIGRDGPGMAGQNFNPFTEGPKYFSGRSTGAAVWKEVPVKGNVEVLLGVEYCGNEPKATGATNARGVASPAAEKLAAAVEEGKSETVESSTVNCKREAGGAE